MNRYKDWLEQAERDFQKAKLDLESMLQEKSSGSVRILSVDHDKLLNTLKYLSI